MPGSDGVEALRELRSASNPARVLVVTSFTEPAAVLPAVRAGAQGFVYKDVRPERPGRGHPRRARRACAAQPGRGRAAHRRRDPAARARLTAREREVLAELADGRSNREIARHFAVSEKTVKTHVSAILAKLGVQDRTQAALRAVRTGLVDP